MNMLGTGIAREVIEAEFMEALANGAAYFEVMGLG